MVMSITFIHAADIHLDRPFLGLNGCPETLAKRVRESTFTALSSLVNMAIAQEVDFVIFAGDIFDSSARGLRAEARLRDFMRQLAIHNIEVFMTHGNHDPLDGYWSGLSYGENVHVFGPTPEMYHFEKESGPSVNIYGFSYATQHVSENMIDYYEKQPGSDFHVGVLHGSIKGNVEHDVYAPFTINELLQKEMDYWALGHIHKREVLNQEPPIIYPGSLQGLSIKETGEKGFYIVTIDKLKTHTEFIKMSDVIWEEKVINASGIDTFDKLVQAAEELKENTRQTSHGVLMRIKIVGESNLPQDSSFDNLMEVIRTGEVERRGFVWVTEIVDGTIPVFDRDKLLESPHFMGDIVRLSDQKQSIHDDIKALYQHQQAKKFLSPLSKEEQTVIMKEAEKLLLMGLHKIGQRTK